ncbi:CMRF35-like molecule 2 isoform X2 [Sparus aurata]|uniref:CMRF35-like molecule 2 n=1 Tax=Sparus aurata TaxID=8175 RepID=A0A671UMH2_SPAAU|nr:CMRF35-like molecule 2 isoform X2 [Sparus aurata]
MLLLIIWLSFAVRCQLPNIRVSAWEGGLAEISCPYDSVYETYPKHFYKGIYAHRMIVIETAAGKKGSTRNGKYYICDDTKQRRLRVTSHNVNLNDAGTYWCEIDAYGFDPKTEIELKVYKAPAPPKPPPVISNPPVLTTVQTITRNQQQSATGNKLYVPVAVAAAVLLLMGFIYCWSRKHRHDTGSTFGGEAAPWINTWSTVLYVKSQNICSIRSLYTEAGDPHISEDSRLLYSTVCFNATDQPTSSQPQVVKQRHLSHAHKRTFPRD